MESPKIKVRSNKWGVQLLRVPTDGPTNLGSVRIKPAILGGDFEPSRITTWAKKNRSRTRLERLRALDTIIPPDVCGMTRAKIIGAHPRLHPLVLLSLSSSLKNLSLISRHNWERSGNIRQLGIYGTKEQLNPQLHQLLYAALGLLLNGFGKLLRSFDSTQRMAHAVLGKWGFATKDGLGNARREGAKSW